MKYLLIIVIFSFLLISCDEESTTNPCDSLSCQENASCIISGDVAECQCDVGFDTDQESCINEKTVDCVDAAPQNGTSIVELVTITFDEETSWSQPANCDWDCLDGYVQDATACVEIAVEVPLDGFGDITGSCGVIDATHLESGDDFVFINTIDFTDDTYDASDFGLLSSGGQILADTENAGGSSSWSEVFSFEMLYRCEFADLLKTETQIVYDIEGSITDILVSMDEYKIGVSVTRAMSWPRDTAYELSQAISLITGKLEGIQESSINVSSEDSWKKQILHVLADRVEHVAVIQEALIQIDENIKGDTIILITVTEGLDDFIYTNEI
jgi:hypothetical protein